MTTSGESFYLPHVDCISVIWKMIFLAFIHEVEDQHALFLRPKVRFSSHVSTYSLA